MAQPIRSQRAALLDAGFASLPVESHASPGVQLAARAAGNPAFPICGEDHWNALSPAAVAKREIVGNVLWLLAQDSR
jgi:hypothetical protein